MTSFRSPFALLPTSFYAYERRIIMAVEMKGMRRLTDLEIGQSATVAKIKVDAKEEARLNELGLHRGSDVRILHGAKNEAILLAVGDGRIGVNYDVARQIYVF